MPLCAYLDDDEARLNQRDSGLFLGLSIRELKELVQRGEITPADIRNGRMWFQLGELRRYSRNVAQLTASRLPAVGSA